jgi:hypothetical protein
VSPCGEAKPFYFATQNALARSPSITQNALARPPVPVLALASFATQNALARSPSTTQNALARYHFPVSLVFHVKH